MLISNLIFVLKSHCRKFKITNGLIDKSPYSPFKIDMSQQDNDFEEPKFTLKILKYVTTEKMALLVTCYIHPTWYVLPSLGSSTEELNNNKCRQNVFLCFISSFYSGRKKILTLMCEAPLPKPPPPQPPPPNPQTPYIPSIPTPNPCTPRTQGSITPLAPQPLLLPHPKKNTPKHHNAHDSPGPINTPVGFVR